MLTNTPPEVQSILNFNPQTIEFFDNYYSIVGGCEAICFNPFDVRPEHKYHVSITPAKGKVDGSSFKPALRSIESLNSNLAVNSPMAIVHGKGVTADGAFGMVSAFTEIDDAPFEEQKARWAAFSKETGIKCSLIFSGGKSIHGHVLLDKVEQANSDQHLLAMKLLTLLVGGDTAIIKGNAVRSMRTPGYKSEFIEQTILDAPKERYSINAVIKACEAAILKRGWYLGSIDGMVEAAAISHRCTVMLRFFKPIHQANAVCSMPHDQLGEMIKRLEMFEAQLGYPNYNIFNVNVARSICSVMESHRNITKLDEELEEAKATSNLAMIAEVIAKKNKQAEFSVKEGDSKEVKADFEFEVQQGYPAATVTLPQLNALPSVKKVTGSVKLVCPACNYEKPNYCKAVWTKAGTSFVKCFHCGAKFFLSKKLEWSAVGGSGQYPIPHNYEKVSGKYLSEDVVQGLMWEKHPKYIYIRAPRGSGKTTAIAKATAYSQVWNVTHRKSLARGLVDRFGEMFHYDDFDKVLWDRHSRITVVVDSLIKIPKMGTDVEPYFLEDLEAEGEEMYNFYKTGQTDEENLVSLLIAMSGVELEPYNYESAFDSDSSNPVVDYRPVQFENVPKILNIDEASQVYRHLVGETVERNIGVMHAAVRLGKYVAESKTVILSDADMDADVVGMTRKLAGRDPTQTYDDELFIELVQPVTTKRTIKLWPAGADAKSLFITKVVESADAERIYLNCALKADTNVIHKMMLQAHIPEQQILVVTGENTNDSKIIEFMSNPDAWLAAHPEVRHLLVSPAVNTGVDISIQGRFDKVYGLQAPAPYRTVFDVFQGLERVRHPVSSEIELWVDKTEFTASTDPERQRMDALTKIITTSELLTLANGGFNEIGDPKLDNTMPLELMGQVRAYEAAHSNNLRERVIEVAKQVGWDLELYNPTSEDGEAEQLVASRKKLAEIRAELKKARIDRVLNAEVGEITEELVEAARHTLSGGTSTCLERAAAVKIITADLVGGVDRLDSEVVEMALHGELLGTIDRSLYMAGYFGTNPAVLPALNRKALASLKRKYGGAHTAESVATAIFASTFKLESGTDYIDFVETKDSHKKISVVIEAMNKLGVKTNATMSPLALIGRQLRKCGYVCSVIRHGTAKVPVALRVTRESVDRMNLISEARRKKIIHADTNVTLNLKATVFTEE